MQECDGKVCGVYAECVNFTCECPVGYSGDPYTECKGKYIKV